MHIYTPTRSQNLSVTLVDRVRLRFLRSVRIDYQLSLLKLLQDLISQQHYPSTCKAGRSAPESEREQRGESPLQTYALRSETECNCVAAR